MKIKFVSQLLTTLGVIPHPSVLWIPVLPTVNTLNKIRRQDAAVLTVTNSSWFIFTVALCRLWGKHVDMSLLKKPLGIHSLGRRFEPIFFSNRESKVVSEDIGHEPCKELDEQTCILHCNTVFQAHIPEWVVCLLSVHHLTAPTSRNKALSSRPPALSHLVHSTWRGSESLSPTAGMGKGGWVLHRQPSSGVLRGEGQGGPHTPTSWVIIWSWWPGSYLLPQVLREPVPWK